ncbi:MAG: arginine--tRNA ligase [Oscillospiraceae bacterium]|nr:arginine--tRNA ligase [Oscillospiraceae bacterium]
MQKLIDLLSGEVSAAFQQAGYDPAYGKVTVSGRPDLGEYQCNGAMPAAKVYHKAPFQIADEAAQALRENPAFLTVEAVKPGFLNLRLSPAFLSDYLNAMTVADHFGLDGETRPKTIVLDYGGPNVAKPLHVGHLRSAIIGESIKRLYRYFGNNVIGDIHMGDWGLQMGLIIAELRERQPDLPYFDDAFSGPYPEKAPFTISELEEIYPTASAKSKVDEDFARKAHEATYLLQTGNPGCTALWKHIMAVSVADLKQNYGKLDVSFDVWYGESDAEPYIAPMLQDLKAQGLLRESDGALVMDVTEEGDAKEMPPCILVKSDGATLYATTDLATLSQREQCFRPDKVLYIVDKRQSLHFEQVFRAARKGGIVRPETELQHIGFGTMNGKDGKPFKTREGGVMRLERLIAEITDFVTEKVRENQIVSADEVDGTAQKIAMAALKYGDLSNLATKDYVFDLDRFAAFEGNTGPYILYTIVRIKSILSRYGKEATRILPPETAEEKDLMLSISRFSDHLQAAYRDSAPNVLCAYIYELSGAVNKFYHETRILTEEDANRQAGYIALISLSRRILETCIALLGFSAPEKM